MANLQGKPYRLLLFLLLFIFRFDGLILTSYREYQKPYYDNTTPKLHLDV
jgi:hypothetical protein